MKHTLLAAMAMLGSILPGKAALTWSFTGSAPATELAQITSAMNTAVNNFNTWANYSGNITVAYNAGVPTAQASYQGWIEFGGSRSARVAQHEMAHWLGTGTYSNWNANRSGNTWTGVIANAKLKSFDGASAVLSADAQHWWPYGWNQDNEGPADKHIAITGGLRRDMGLSDTSIGVPLGTYKLQNRANGKMLDNLGASGDGASVGQWDSGGSNNQRWTVTRTGNYFKLVCVTGGKRLDTLGNTADGSVIGQWTDGGSYNQQWTFQATDSGYYKIINRANGKCLDTGGQTGNGAIMQNWYSGSSHNQHWKFVKP